MEIEEKINNLSEKIHKNIKVAGEKLTPLERFNSVHIYQKPPDRILAWAFYREYPRYLVNYTIKELETDHLKECASVLAGISEFQYDTVWTNVDVYSVIAEVLGCELSMHEDAVSVPVGSLLKKPEDLKHLKSIDPYEDGRLPVVLKTVSLLREKIGDVYPILGHASGPISLASILRGGTKFTVDLKKRPEFFSELLDFCSEQIIIFCKALLDMGATGVNLADAAGSPSMLSPKQYTELYMPAYKKIQRELGHLTPAGVRWHSQSGFEELNDLPSFLEESLSAGNNIVHVSTPWSLKLDLNKILKLCKKYNGILWFGIAPSSFTNLSAEELKNEIKEYIQNYAKGYEGNIQIGPNMLNDTTKPELIKAYMDAIKEHGQCPIK